MRMEAQNARGEDGRLFSSAGPPVQLRLLFSSRMFIDYSKTPTQSAVEMHLRPLRLEQVAITTKFITLIHARNGLMLYFSLLNAQGY